MVVRLGRICSKRGRLYGLGKWSLSSPKLSYRPECEGEFMNSRLHAAVLTSFLLCALSPVVELTVAAKQAETSNGYGDYDFTLTTLDGRKVKLSASKDKA